MCNIWTEWNGPPQNNRFTIVKSKYECFYSYGDNGMDVGNTIVNCSTVWLLETAGVSTFDKGMIVNHKNHK